MNNNGHRRFEPPNSHSIEGGPRMTLAKPKAPPALRPGMHRVLAEVAPGEWQIVGDTGQDIELLKIDVAKDHAIGCQQANMMIVDEENKPVTKFENFKPLPQVADSPISPENQRIRDRWVASIINWLIPSELRAASATPENQQKIRDALKELKVELSISGLGTEAIILRDGQVLSAWYC